MALGSSQASTPFCAAVIASAHGIHGHVKVKCFLENPSKFMDYSPYLNEKGEEVYKVKKVLVEDKDILTISLEGLVDRTAAENLKGANLMLSPDRLPALSEDTFYHKDLIGLSVKSLDNQLLGEVHALYNFGAGDLLEVKTLEGKLQIIPFTQKGVPEVNIAQGYLILSAEGEMFLKGEFHVS